MGTVTQVSPRSVLRAIFFSNGLLTWITVSQDHPHPWCVEVRVRDLPSTETLVFTKGVNFNLISHWVNVTHIFFIALIPNVHKYSGHIIHSTHIHIQTTRRELPCYLAIILTNINSSLPFGSRGHLQSHCSTIKYPLNVNPQSLQRSWCANTSLPFLPSTLLQSQGATPLMYRAWDILSNPYEAAEPPGPWTLSLNMPVITRHWWLGSEVTHTSPELLTPLAQFSLAHTTSTGWQTVENSSCSRNPFNLHPSQPYLHHLANLFRWCGLTNNTVLYLAMSPCY